MEFPRLVYRSATSHKLTQDEAEHAAALADGWFGSVPEALAPKVGSNAAVVSDAPPTRAELEAKATELRIKFDGRTPDAKLAAAISAALKA